jgi:hypothetical protein
MAPHGRCEYHMVIQACDSADDRADDEDDDTVSFFYVFVFPYDAHRSIKV